MLSLLLAEGREHLSLFDSLGPRSCDPADQWLINCCSELRDVLSGSDVVVSVHSLHSLQG